VNPDPIGLESGFNVYQFAPNVQDCVDPLGLANRKTFNLGKGYTGALDIFDSGKNQVLKYMYMTLKEMKWVYMAQMNGLKNMTKLIYQNDLGITKFDRYFRYLDDIRDEINPYIYNFFPMKKNINFEEKKLFMILGFRILKFPEI
jgi:rhs-family protein (fragment)